MSDIEMAAETAPNEAETMPEPRPDYVPEKFWDAEGSQVRTEALARSYGELERKLGGSVAVPGDDADSVAIGRFHRALGVPETPDGYRLEVGATLGRDPQIDAYLHAAGLTPVQAQLVYDLAAEVLPRLNNAAAGVAAAQQTAAHELERLNMHYGPEKWAELRGRLGRWARANLPAEAFESLAGSFEGVRALERMMAGDEPALVRAGEGAPGLGEADVKRLMQDPRYWRDRDPDLVAQVRAAWSRLYPD